MQRMIIFDDGLGQFGPITDLRASFEVRTGVFTNAGRLGAMRPNSLAGYWVPQRIERIVADRASAPVNRLPDDESLLLVNGRWALPDFNAKLRMGEAMVEARSGHVIAAAMTRSQAEQFLQSNVLPDRINTHKVAEPALLQFAWEILTACKKTIALDIAQFNLADAGIPPATLQVVGNHPVDIHRTARVFPNVVFDAEIGPIMIHERATIRPGAVICGPASIGPDSTIIDRALIKATTVIGPHCKIGGEVGSTIFQGYSNKSHDGHLGDSYVGKWVNLGADTNNSNLLNTYGEVIMRLEPDGPRARTGMQFLGAIIGDHVKTAIGTRIMTGTVLGTGAMIACSCPPPSTVKRFAWLTDDNERERFFQIEKFLDVMRTVMARRNITPSAVYVDAVKALHASTAK